MVDSRIDDSSILCLLVSMIFCFLLYVPHLLLSSHSHSCSIDD
jgi:hypothetical protein